ncbi:MAG: hypothetical protein A2046_16780 [Bacteroidetes bacterium GWA2_30_7]|nr:MAG: hypothetical protein A2046_16780 [Bacteroidetes bacterium GWA2_30_7]
MNIKKLIITYLLFIIAIPTFSQSLLWKISGKGLKKPSYLYGTIHIQDKRVFSFEPIVNEKLNECEAYAMEVLLDELDKESIQNAMLMKDITLDKLMSKEDYDFLAQFIKEKTGMSLFLFNKTKPFFIMSQVMQAGMSKDKELPLDMYFLDLAHKANKKTLGIEKFEEQMAAVDQISLQEQVRMLLESAKDTVKEEDSFDKLLEAYLSENLDQMLKLSNDSTMPANFNDAFLINRNVRMAQQIAKFSKKQTTFNAIGAAHLGGPKGVIELLRQKGFIVEPVPFKFQDSIKF